MRQDYTPEVAADNAVRDRARFMSSQRDVSPGGCSKSLMSIGTEKKSEPFVGPTLLMGKTNHGIRNTL
jgi:hypothetical protein